MSNLAQPGGASLDSAIRKARGRILPFLVLMYILAFVDRSNVGFAKSVLQADTGIGNAAFAFGAGVFFLSYALFEVPSNLILYRVGARIWLSRIMITWGIVAACMSLINSAESFYVLRFLLGITEAGFFPGIILYLTLWFPKNARAQTMGMFYFGLPLALVFGSPLSGILLDIPAPLGLHPWQVMFIIEGLMACAVGVIAFFFLTDRPFQAEWLGDEERTALSGAMQAEDDDKLRHGPRSLLAAIASPRIITLCLIYFTIQVSVYGVVFYLPTRIAGLIDGHVGTVVGFLTAIPWLAAIVVTFLVTRLADRTGTHRELAALMLLIAALGIAASALCGSVGLAIFAFCFAAGGFVCVQPLFWTLPTDYLGGGAAAGGIGLINAIGNLGGFFAPNLKNYVEQSTGQVQMGMFALAFVGLVGAIMMLVFGKYASGKN
jgi:MFS family permease